MEMIMSTISSTAKRDIADNGFVAAAGRAVKGWWLARLAKRIERAAIDHLHAMSDRELKDIGIHRSQIEFVVRGDRALSHGF